MNIRSGTESDAPRCRELALQVTLAAAGSEKAGFLLGMETIEDYRGFLHEGISLLAEDAAGGLLGFLVAYYDDSPLVAKHAGALRDAVWEASSPLGGPYCYVEKIAVSPLARRQGIARALYLRLLAQVADRAVLAAIVEAPHCNHASRDFHSRLGFVRAGESVRKMSANQPQVRLGLYMRREGA